MAIKAEIVGTKTVASVCPVERSSAKPKQAGLVVLTENLIRRDPEFILVRNDEFGVALNQNASTGGSPSGIHDGTDSALWAGSNIVGSNVTFSSITRPQNGVGSVAVIGPTLNDVWEFDSGTTISLSSFVSFSLGINVDRRWTTDSVEIYGWDGAEVGNRVKLEDYFSENEFDVWHQIMIPFGDMGLTNESITGIRMEYVTKSGASVEFFLDDIQMEQTGGSILFKAIAPKKENAFHIFSLIMTFTDNIGVSSTEGASVGLSYNKLLGLSQLTNGIILSRVVDDVTRFAFPFKSIGDMVGIGFEIRSIISDQTNTQISVYLDFPEPVIVKGSPTNNYIGLTIQDDLSSLIRFTCILRGASEIPEEI